MELVVVIFILAILAALILPRVFGRTSDAKISKALSDIASLRNQIQMYKSDTGSFPTVLQDLRTRPADGADGWRGPYLDKEIPTDPWGGEYDYIVTSDDSDFTVICYGKDHGPGGDPGTEDADLGEALNENQ
jgi:general secretion pathway protein G